MKIEIKVPSVGESVVEATVGALLKQSGSLVKADEEILELETDKVNQIVYAPAAGVLELRIKTGDVVNIGQTIGSVDTDAAKPPEPLIPSKLPSPAASLPSVSTSLPPVRKSVEASLASQKQDTKPSPSPTPVAVPPHASSSRETRQKISKLRSVIAERLVAVKNQTAMLTTFNEVDLSQLIAVRDKEKENFQTKHGVKLGFMSFFVKATVAALKEMPALNARIEGKELVFCHYYDIGIAVSTEKGLMVPVLRNADLLSSVEIERGIKNFAEKAKKGTVSVDDLQGGTFTITNGGTFGSMLSTPILNPPQSGILGMHNIVKRPVVVNDEIVIRPIMYLALSYDHRIVDGKEAIGFLVHIKKNLEEPARLLLEL